jgi:Effector protein
MTITQYSQAIRIHDFEGSELGNGNTIQDPKRAKQFIKNVTAAADGLKKLATGRLLLEEINNSGKTVDIILAAKGKDGCAMTVPNGNFQAQVNAMVKSFRPFVTNLEHAQKDNSANLGIKGRNLQMPSRAVEFYQRQVDQHLGGQTAEAMLPEFQKIIERASRRYSDPFKMLSQLTGINLIELFQMSKGKKPIDDSTYFKICVYFYEFLQPGPGCNTAVRLEFDVGLADTKGGRNYKKSVDAVEPRIMLAHELIHAWRMMKGRRIVRRGWEEEAMTVGLAFAAGWPITENRLRMEAGQPRRSSYSGLTDVSSHWAKDWKGSRNQ